MSNDSLLSGHTDRSAPEFSFMKANHDKDSKRNPMDSVTVQGVTADGSPFSKARIPLDDQGQVVISEESFGDDDELAFLVAHLLDAEGWDYVEA